ncbi:SufE family protein, partial [Xanthomonas oryzae pv. oryzae]
MDEAIRIEFLPGFARTLTPTPAQR